MRGAAALPRAPSSWPGAAAPGHRPGCSGKGAIPFPLPSFGEDMCQSRPLCTVSVWCVGCFPSSPGGRAVPPCWLCTRAPAPWLPARQVFAQGLCWGQDPGCAGAASLLLAETGPEPGVCFLSGSRCGGCTASRKGIGIAALALLGRLLWLVPAWPTAGQAGARWKAA